MSYITTEELKREMIDDFAADHPEIADYLRRLSDKAFRDFMKWMTHDVLPSVLNTGSYAADQPLSQMTQ